MTLPAVPVVEPPKVYHYRGSRRPRDYRCHNDGCSRLLMRAVLMPGCYIETRCPKCGRMTIITFEPNGDGKHDLMPEAEQKESKDDNNDKAQTRVPVRE